MIWGMDALRYPKHRDLNAIHAVIFSKTENKMYRIVDKKVLSPTAVQLKIEAPLVASKARPGQFIILRVDAVGTKLMCWRKL